MELQMISILGADYEEFKKVYLEEIMNPENFIYYVKCIFFSSK